METALVACGLWLSQNGGDPSILRLLDISETFSTINYGILFSQLQGLEMEDTIYTGSPPLSIADSGLRDL